jgi:hypothetical protein
MGDHRPKIPADFEMHGHKAHFDFGWCNWSPDNDGVDRRVVDWFREQAAIAIAKWAEEVAADKFERNRREFEDRERAELVRLKGKYEQRPVTRGWR